MNVLSQDTVLLLIDVQKGLDDPTLGRRNNPGAEANMSRLLRGWRATGRPVIHVQHCSARPASPLWPDKPGVEFKEEVRPIEGEPIFRKTVNSAFIGTGLETDIETGLETHLRERDLNTLVIVGLTTEHCVSATTRMASDLGFETYLVADATATFDRTGYDGQHYPAEQVHGVALASLHGEFATVVETDEIVAHL